MIDAKNGEFYITVHPHTCGANAFIPDSIRIRQRFIPTHVGLIQSCTRHTKSRTVHPHTCGANVESSEYSIIDKRFIPTHVGLIAAQSYLQQKIPVHPHTCGANGFP